MPAPPPVQGVQGDFEKFEKRVEAAWLGVQSGGVMAETEKVRATLETVTVGEELGPVEYDLAEDDVAQFIDRVENVSAERLLLPDGRRAAPSTVIGGDYVKLLTTKYSTYDVVHARAKHRFVRPIVAPVHIVVTGKLTEKYLRRGREYLVVETVTRDGDGNELAVSENTWLINASVRQEPESDSEGDPDHQGGRT